MEDIYNDLQAAVLAGQDAFVSAARRHERALISAGDAAASLCSDAPAAAAGNIVIL